MSLAMIKAHQVRKIHALKGRLGLDDDLYRTRLDQSFNVRSCKHLSEQQAAKFIEELEAAAIAAGVWQARGRQRYQNFAERDDAMASPAQLRKVEAMWAEKSRIKDDPVARRQALDKFCKRITGIERLVWIEKKHVRMLIKAIENMR